MPAKDAVLQGSESDRIFRARLLGGGELFIYCLVEHQSTADPRMPLRLLGYLLRLWEHMAGEEKAPRLPAILPMVVYHGEAPWTVPVLFSGMVSTPEAVLPHCLDFQYTLLDLGKVGDQELSRQRRLRIGLMALKYATRAREQLRKLDELMSLASLEPGMHLMLWLYMIDTYKAVDELTFDAARRKYMPKLDLENASLAAKKWFAEGEAKGKAEGKAETLLRLLGRRFGEIPPQFLETIKAATIEDLDAWLDRAIDATSIEAVFSPTPH